MIKSKMAKEDFYAGLVLSLLLFTSEGKSFKDEYKNQSCTPVVEANANCRCDKFMTFHRHPIWCLNGSVSLPFCYCMSYNEKFNTTVVGYCAARCYVSSHSPERKVFTGVNRYQVIVKSHNRTEFNDDACSGLHMNRTGQMCGSCVKGYAPPVYSYSLACVECSDYKYNWIKYIAVAYLPLTLFFVIVITFRISAASGAMNGFILTSQIAMSRALFQYYLSYIDETLKYRLKQIAPLKAMVTFLGIWNLDFFRMIYTPFCLHPNMSTIQTRALDYAVAVYPLVLVVITYIFVSLHYRYSLVVRLWKPFYRCLRCIRKKWDIKDYLIGAFATFILLSYVKILTISLDLLMPVVMYDIDGNALNQLYLQIDGTVEYFRKDHLPYGILALVMVIVFNILPLILLAIFPCRCFHRCLNHFQIQRETLREFVEVFNGEFKYQPRDYRYFAAFYLLLRIFNILLLLNTNGIVYFPFGIALFAVSSLLIAFLKPYKKSFHNVADTVLIFVIAVAFLGPPAKVLMRTMGRIQCPKVYSTAWVVFLSIQPLYGVGVLMYIFIPVKKLKDKFTLVFAKTQNLFKRTSNVSNSEDRVPFGPEHMDENTPLIIPTNYNPY